MRISSNGEVTIPAELRERCGLQPGAEVEFEPVEGGLLVRTSREGEEASGRAEQPSSGKAIGDLLIEHLMSFGPLAFTTDEFMGMLREPRDDAPDQHGGDRPIG